MPPDPKWLEILKASGWQTTALAAAGGLFILMAHWGWFSTLPVWVIPAVTFGLLVCGCLALASIGSAAVKLLPIQESIIHWLDLRIERRAVRDYIPYMTEDERRIIAYLLAKNQKTFITDVNGGKAMTLLSRGIVARATHPGQVFHVLNMPVVIPDHVWDVLVEHKKQFPYTPPKPGEQESFPWRIPWMAR